MRLIIVALKSPVNFLYSASLTDHGKQEKKFPPSLQDILLKDIPLGKTIIQGMSSVPWLCLISVTEIWPSSENVANPTVVLNILLNIYLSFSEWVILEKLRKFFLEMMMVEIPIKYISKVYFEQRVPFWLLLSVHELAREQHLTELALIYRARHNSCTDMPLVGSFTSHFWAYLFSTMVE